MPPVRPPTLFPYTTLFRSGQDGDGLAENLVVGQLAPPIIVVVHGGKVIVDERISVDALHRAGQWHGLTFITARSEERRVGQSVQRRQCRGPTTDKRESKHR